MTEINLLPYTYRANHLAVLSVLLEEKGSLISVEVHQGSTG